MPIFTEERKNKIFKFITFLKENKDDIAAIELYEILEDFSKEQQYFVHKSEIKEILIEMKEGFKRMDQKFQAQDKRFEDLIREMNSKFEAQDKRFEDLIREMNSKFEAQDKRFEDLIREMNSKFEIQDKRFEDLIREMNNRFEAQNKRFEDLIREINNRFQAQDKKITLMTWILTSILTIFFGLSSIINYIHLNYQKDILQIFKNHISTQQKNIP